MPIPERFRRLFAPELAQGEQVRAVSNADLWLRYRRIAITDRRVLVVERGAIRRPRGGRRVTSIPLTDIADVTSSANPVATEVVFHTRDGGRHGYAMPTISRGTKRFAGSVRGLVLAGGIAVRRAMRDAPTTCRPRTSVRPRSAPAGHRSARSPN